MQNENARGGPAASGWDRHIHTVLTALMLAVLGYIGTQYTGQGTRISVAEVRIGGTEKALAAVTGRMTRLEDQRDREMTEIRAYLQRIEDKLDRKADKP